MGSGLPLLGLLAVLGSLWGCAAPHRILVLYDRPGALKPGDRVVWENREIGAVGDFQANPSGKTAVPLRVNPDYRHALTDQSRFSIQADPDRPGSRSVRMTLLSAAGKPLPDGAVVEGSTGLSVLGEKVGRDLQGISQALQEALERLGKEWDRFSLRERQKELEQELEAWILELKKGGEEARRHFEAKILPEIQRLLQDLLRRLRELGKEADARYLEEKLESLKEALRDGKGKP